MEAYQAQTKNLLVYSMLSNSKSELILLLLLHLLIALFQTVLVLVLLAASITLFLGCDTRFQVSKSWCFSRPSILEPIQRRVSSAKIFKQSTKWGKALWKSWMPTLHDDDAPWLRDEPDSRVESSASAETFSGYATDLDTMQNVDLKVLMANLRRIVGSGTGDRADDQMETCPASPTPYCAALIFSS